MKLCELESQEFCVYLFCEFAFYNEEFKYVIL